ncbi:MAG TPA: DinB family protein, partial [Dehalococcoidia bacterium]|nr:DinB family protein [Dehalococcoidia bacterium]
MGQRTSALADQFEQALAEFASTLEAIPDDKWTAARGPEGWNLAATAQHVSGQFPLEMEYITAIAEGRPLPSYSWDDINGKNDGRAAKNTSVIKAEVLRELRESGKSVAAYLRGMQDDQLDRTGELA